MLAESSHGRVAPKTKTINVEANLLTQRVTERERIRDLVRLKFAVLTSALLVALVTLPLVYRFHSSSIHEVETKTRDEKFVSAQLANLQKQQEQRKPVLINKELMSSLQSGNNQVIGQLLAFIDNVSPTISLKFVRAKVDAGLIEINTQGDAISYKSASDFVSSTGKLPETKDMALVSMKSNNAVAPEGVSFELTRKAQVGL